MKPPLRWPPLAAVPVLALLLAAFAFSTAAQAGTFSTAAWTNDASTGINPGRTQWAYHFGATTTATINGVATPGLAGPNASNANFDLTGMTSIFNGDTNNVTDVTGTGSTRMAHDFVYGGDPAASVTVKGLTAGRNYVVSFFSVGWEADGGDLNFRLLTFSSGTDSQQVQQSQFGAYNGIRVDYAFTATATTRVITIAVANANNATFHLYGLALQRPPAVTNTNDAGAGSLRAALSDAASYAGADTVMFDAGMNGSTITLLSEIVSNDASGAVSIDASTLPAGLTIDGGPNTNRILSVSAGRDVSVTGVTLTGGNGVGAANSPGGGAIANFGTLALTRCTLSGNAIGDGAGGAILNFGGTLTLTECTLSGNSTTNGGAIFQTTGTATLTKCTLSQNSAIAGGDGGAILNQNGTLTLTQCTVAGNSANAGGAIVNGGTLTLTQCTLSENSAGAGGGGAIYSYTASITGPITSSTTLTHCTLTDNTGLRGGAIRNDNGRTTLTHCTVTANTAPAGNGSGVTSYGDNNTETVVENSIIAGNANSSVDFIFGSVNSFTSLGHNLIGSGNATGDFNQSGDIINNTPLLTPLGNYGGPTQTMLPFLDSAAIDAALGSMATTDQRGASRTTGHGSAPDIGAVELGQTLVNTTADENNGLGTGAKSLREALADSAPFGSELIRFDPAVFTGATPATNTISLGGEIVPGKNVTIDATGVPGGVSISGNNTSRVFSVSSGKNVALLGLTLTGGNGSGGLQNGNGGAIVNFGTLALKRCTLSGNVGDNAGAILNDGGALTLSQCTLSGNQVSGVGGALYQTTGIATLMSCTLSQNSATNGSGGAIFNQNGPLALTHCTLSGNSCGNDGGAIALLAATTTTLTHCIVAGNTAAFEGADIYNDGGTLTRVGANLVQWLFNANGGTDSGPPAINAPPLLAPLADYGGGTKTRALKPGSPARDAAGGSTITSDQRGFPIVDTPDIGAYEAGTLHLNFNAYIWETLPASATDAQHDFDFDYDGDGANNYAEWLAQTDATDPLSRFRITELHRSGNNLSFTFPSVLGRYYVFEYSLNLVPWQPSFSDVYAGTGDPMTFIFPAIFSGNPRFFFRAHVGDSNLLGGFAQ